MNTRYFTPGQQLQRTQLLMQGAGALGEGLGGLGESYLTEEGKLRREAKRQELKNKIKQGGMDSRAMDILGDQATEYQAEASKPGLNAEGSIPGMFSAPSGNVAPSAAAVPSALPQASAAAAPPPPAPPADRMGEFTGPAMGMGAPRSVAPPPGVEPTPIQGAMGRSRPLPTPAGIPGMPWMGAPDGGMPPTAPRAAAVPGALPPAPPPAAPAGPPPRSGPMSALPAPDPALIEKAQREGYIKRLNRLVAAQMLQGQNPTGLMDKSYGLSTAEDPSAVLSDAERLAAAGGGGRPGIEGVKPTTRSGRAARVGQIEGLLGAERTTAAATSAAKTKHGYDIELEKERGRSGISRAEVTAEGKTPKEDPQTVADEVNAVGDATGDIDALKGLSPTTKAAASARGRAIAAALKASGAYDPTAAREAAALNAQAAAADMRANNTEKDLKVKYPLAFDSFAASGASDAEVSRQKEAVGKEMETVGTLRQNAVGLMNQAAERLLAGLSPKGPAEGGGATGGKRWQDDPEAARIRDDANMAPEAKRTALEALKAKYAAPAPR